MNQASSVAYDSVSDSAIGPSQYIITSRLCAKRQLRFAEIETKLLRNLCIKSRLSGELRHQGQGHTSERRLRIQGNLGYMFILDTCLKDVAFGVRLEPASTIRWICAFFGTKSKRLHSACGTNEFHRVGGWVFGWVSRWGCEYPLQGQIPNCDIRGEKNKELAGQEPAWSSSRISRTLHGSGTRIVRVLSWFCLYQDSSSTKVGDGNKSRSRHS